MVLWCLINDHDFIEYADRKKQDQEDKLFYKLIEINKLIKEININGAYKNGSPKSCISIFVYYTYDRILHVFNN